MAALTPSDVRKRIATHVALLTPWKESPVPADVFGRSPDSLAHQAFAVGVLPLAVVGDRQSYVDGAQVRTECVIRYAWRVAPKAQLPSYDAALAAGQALVAQVMARTTAPVVWPGDLTPTLTSLAGTVQESGEWFLGEARLSIYHLLALQ